jgi:hypothetical protein
MCDNYAGKEREERGREELWAFKRVNKEVEES